MLDAIDLHENFINVESVTESVTFLLEALGVFRTEPVAPESDGFLTDFNATFMEQIFDVPKAKVKTMI